MNSTTWPKVEVLIEGYASQKEGNWYASPSTVLISENGRKIIVDPGANKTQLLKALQNKSLKTEDIDTVFLTHYHLDHIFNLRLFPQAILCDGEALITDEKMSDHDGKIPGTGIQILSTPGHDSKHWSLLVKTEIGVIAIAGDVFWWQDHEDQKTSFPEILEKTDPFVQSESELRNSRQKLLAIADFVIPGHGKMFPVPI